ncbi:putative transposase in snaA-snaB intergenic region protein [Marine Group I thaumarchaeote SCGC RSA3]|uniref:Putative transposase in snaA-snaB intergenic region protein n=1 Tax=Marine Group I thaumarchaeote SCGC RSA3 TaxID=1503183 RepID=A0A087RU26_9ARCH|nr:putative transposase in snaA-snaB intergenic region protein [Marine Group I thaumarchaeote SCGC RSA3]
MELKEEEPWLYEHHSKMLQMVAVQVDGAQKGLLQLRKNGHNTGPLKFAKFLEYNTFTYNQSGFQVGNGFLYLSKIGKIKLKQHRQISENSEIKQVTVTKSKSGKWYACITYEIDVVIPTLSFQKSVGIDIGVKNFAYDSDGFVTPNPLNLQKMLKPLRRIQRKISRRQPGSNNRKKALKWYQIIHERIKNRRKDFLHKVSTQYARKYDVIFVERLAKLNMVKNHRMARSIMDSGWGIFTNMLDYKVMTMEVSAKNTTLKCSGCCSAVPKSLAVRTHRCDECGLILDRDHNAAINILKKGLDLFGITLDCGRQNDQLPQELRELTPVEISKRSRKQEASRFAEG